VVVRTRLQRALARPATAVVVLLLGVYAYFYQAGGWNQNSRFDLVRAVVEDHALQIDRFEANTGDDARRDGHYYSDKAPGAAWLCIPPYAAAYYLSGAPDPVAPGWLAWAAWFSIVLAVGVPSAIAAVFVGRLAGALGAAPWGRALASLGWGLGTMALPYATLLYGNQLAASSLVIAFALLVEVRRGAAPTRTRLLVIGALLAFSGACEYTVALIAAPIAVYGGLVVGWRRAAWAILGGVVPAAALLGYHAAAFGGPFTFPYDYSVWDTPRTGWFMGIHAPSAQVLALLLVGPYRGLLYSTPWLVFAVPGAISLARRHRAEVAVCACAVLGFVVFNASIPPWGGGWAPGPRYLVPMLPFAVALACGVFGWIASALRSPSRPRRAVALGGAVVVSLTLVVSVANMFAATAVRPEVDIRWNRPYEEFVWPSFRSGLVSVSTQSIDMDANLPGGPRAAWNLGMKLGLDGHASLVPLYAWILACAAWLAIALRRAVPVTPSRDAASGEGGT